MHTVGIRHVCHDIGRLREFWLTLKVSGHCQWDIWLHTHPFNGPFSGTTRVSRYQKGKTNLDFTEVRDNEWRWHQLGHMQVCTSLHTDDHASTPPLSFLQAGCPSCYPTNSVKALKADIWLHYLSCQTCHCWQFCFQQDSILAHHACNTLKLQGSKLSISLLFIMAFNLMAHQWSVLIMRFRDSHISTSTSCVFLFHKVVQRHYLGEVGK